MTDSSIGNAPLAAVSDTPLGEDLKKATSIIARAPRANFFALVSLLERLSSEAGRVGTMAHPSREVLRFGHSPSLAFSPSDVELAELVELRPGVASSSAETRAGVRLITTFLGLTGGISPLPLYLAEEVLREDADEGWRRTFLDIFHHRAISLLYRLVSRYNIAAEFESDGRDAWSERLLALAGVECGALPHRAGELKGKAPSAKAEAVGAAAATPAVPRWLQLRLLPLLASGTRSSDTLAAGLTEALRDTMHDPQICIRQFRASTSPIDADQRCLLGQRNHRLGGGLVLGQRFSDRGSHFKVEIGPIGKAVYPRLLPQGDLHARLVDVTQMLSPEHLTFAFDLRLTAAASPTFRLRTAHDAQSAIEGGSGLGHGSWLLGAAVERRVTVQPCKPREAVAA